MSDCNNCIPELFTLEVIETLKEKYECLYGKKPFDVSHWNPSEQTKQWMYKYLVLPTNLNSIDYHFSYTLENINLLLAKFGFKSKKGILITPSGSASISAITNLIRTLSVHELTVYSPVYFS
ncbi:MAG: hypothetical protein QM500_07755, partial [Methylococcales bacterium]